MNLLTLALHSTIFVWISSTISQSPHHLAVYTTGAFHCWITLHNSAPAPQLLLLNRHLNNAAQCIIYSAVHYNSTAHSALQCRTVQCRAVQYSAVKYSLVQCSALQCSTVQYSTVQYSTVHYNVVQCS